MTDWLEKVRSDLNEKFLEIQKRAEDLYHKEYGDKGSPWTFNKKGKQRNESGSSWQKKILGELKKKYHYELSRLSVK
jgi:hypothetical protein